MGTFIFSKGASLIGTGEVGEGEGREIVGLGALAPCALPLDLVLEDLEDIEVMFKGY